MISDLEGAKKAIARVTLPADSKVSGTAFYIGDGFVITAFHVVADTTGTPPVRSERVVLNFKDASHETDATIVEGFYDPVADWAVLKCDDPPDVDRFEPAMEVERNAQWNSYGFPEINAEGMTVRGTVEDPQGTFAGAAAIETSCVEAAAGAGARLHGLSGAPCLVGWKAVGILRATLVEEVVDGARKRLLHTVAGRVYASPVRSVVNWQIGKSLPRLPGGWSPGREKKDFLVFLSSSEGKYKKLEPVAKAAQERLKNKVASPLARTAARAFETSKTLLDTVRDLCRARLVVFDATGFEPAIMLLLGIRCVVKRGITILSVGKDYALGGDLNVPFNIRDANVVAHSVGQSKPVDLLAGRIEKALKELELSSYVDNPVYDSIRRLPSDRRGVIPKNEGVLVLCPFNETYNADIWTDRKMRGGLENQLKLLGGDPARSGSLGVARSFELNSPRLVTQALYEYIRRAQACVIDLTNWSPNVLFELGVRLAASQDETSCIVSNKPLENAEWSPQIEKIRALFVHSDGIYDPANDWEEENAYKNAYGPDATLPLRGKTLCDGTIHLAITEVLDIDDEPPSRSVVKELMDSAKLFGKGQNNKPVGLYPKNTELVGREASAEFERLFAAWCQHWLLSSETERKARQWKETASEIGALLFGSEHKERTEGLQGRAELHGMLDALKMVLKETSKW